ncbi:MAG: glutamate--tRNA ligase [Alphaproteobacteria bacterium]
MASKTAPVTRFAPSPTGFLHIGGVRTAIFNWLFAKANGGSFLLRIEDTDKSRSTPEAVEAIISGLEWMGLNSDAEPVFQATRAKRHQEIANQLLNTGHAYRCYSSQAELAVMRERAEKQGLPRAYDGTWRERSEEDAPPDVAPVIRFKAIHSGTSTIVDEVQGSVARPNETSDDLIILRADGSPTYNLSVVVDDHDMGVTHVIRGDDHLNNAFRQKQIYEALGWKLPTYAHIPLIHGSDGAKLSKRHGALGVEAYREMGYQAEAIFSYLIKLGWSEGDEDYVSRARALKLFNLEGIGRSPSRLDLDKLKSTNKIVQDSMSATELMAAARKFSNSDLDVETIAMINKAACAIQERSATLQDVCKHFDFFTAQPPLLLDEKASKALDEGGKQILTKIRAKLDAIHDWSHENVTDAIKGFASDNELKVGKVFQPLRAALTGTMASPGVSEMMIAFGKKKTLVHIDFASS